MSRLGALRSIDVHNHVFQSEWFEDLRKDHHILLPELERESTTRKSFALEVGSSGIAARFVPDTIFDLKKRRAELKRLKIDIQVLSAVPFLFFYDLPTEVALQFTRAQNEGIARIVQDYPDEFVGLSCVPLQDPELAVSELERSVKHLGLKGVEIGSNVNGLTLDDRSLWPFYGKAQDLGVPIMVHPVGSGVSRLRKYYLGNFLGNPLETSIAVSSVVFGGVLKSFPRLKFYFVHGGGFIPYQRGRLSHGFKVRPEPKEIISVDPEYYLDKIYFDSVLHYPRALEFLVRTHGSGKVLLGSDYPFDMRLPNPVDSIRNLKLSDRAKSEVIGKNAAEMFKLKLE